jgi:hypothetical protein
MVLSGHENQPDFGLRWPLRRTAASLQDADNRGVCRNNANSN